MDIDAAAAALDEARAAASPIAQLSASLRFDLDAAYRIQAAGIARRLERGERRSGAKMGLTSRAKAAQMGVQDPIYGRLTDAMLVEEGGAANAGAFIHPRVEPELSEAQELLWASDTHSVLVVLQAMDAGGKDGTIRRVMTGMNPQGVRVTSFKVPTEEELAHDFLWRINRALPRKGMIGVFNRSHYE